MNASNTTRTTSRAAAGPVAARMDRMAQGAHSRIDSASGAAERMAAGAHTLVNKADDLATHTAKTLSAKGDRLAVMGNELIATGTGRMRNHPILTLGLAVAAGYVLSLLVASRRKLARTEDGSA
jgi:ElaB/YqjD/DUF883 family membrane-anchored ribosome-binding protein